MVSLKKNGLIILAVVLISFYLQALSTTPDVPKAFSDSYEKENKKKYTEAINSLTSVYDERSYPINLRLGWLYYSSKDYVKSLEYYTKAIDLKPKSIEARLGYQKPAIALEMWDKVLEKYEEILKIDPNHTYSLYWAGMIYYNKGKFDTALKHFQKVVELYPFDSDSNLMAGWSNFKLGNINEAKEYFQATLLIVPGSKSAKEGLEYCK
jgi:tetratricopeptide (TPR) repeat protein